MGRINFICDDQRITSTLLKRLQEIRAVITSAALFLDLLHNKGTEAQLNVVCANAGMAISTVEKTTPLQGFEKAKEALLSGSALKAFKKLQQLSEI